MHFLEQGTAESGFLDFSEDVESVSEIARSVLYLRFFDAERAAFLVNRMIGIKDCLLIYGSEGSGRGYIRQIYYLTGQIDPFSLGDTEAFIHFAGSKGGVFD